MTNHEFDALAAAYFRFAARSDAKYRGGEVLDEPSPDTWAWEHVDLMLNDWHTPSEALDILLRLIACAPLQYVAKLGAGPLETLVGKHGDELVDRLVAAAQDERVCLALVQVMLARSDVSWSTLVKLKEVTNDAIRVV